MRLLFIIDCLGSGGAQRQIVNLALGLTRRGHTAELFLYHPGHDHFRAVLQEAGIAIHVHHKRGRFSLGPIQALQLLMRRGRYDAALAFLPTPALYAELARLGTRNLPLVVSERSAYPGNSLPPTTWMLQQAHRLASHITVNSHHQRERMERKFPWMRGRLTTIYNGVDLTRFIPRAHPRGVVNRLRFLVLSSVVPNKNALGLARALACYRDQYGGTCRVDWAGQVTSDPVSRKEFAEADRLLVELGLRDQWTWLGERRDIPELLRSHDALIHPSFHEGLPNAVCESMACGKPVLASAVCDHARLVQEGITGMLFDPARPDHMAQVIHRYDRLSSAARARMGRAARSYAEKELSMEVCAGRYEELLLRLRRQNSCGNGRDRADVGGVSTLPG